MEQVDVIADPKDYEDLAYALLSRASLVDDLRAQLLQGLSATNWTGPSSDLFQNKAASIRAALDSEVTQLRNLASQLRAAAQSLADELAHLKAVEMAADAWYAANPGVPAPWPQGSLPPSGTPQWREVEEAFTNHGIYLVTGTAAPGPATSGALTSAAMTGSTVPSTTVATDTVDGVPVTPAEKWIIDHEDASHDTSAYNPIDTSTGHAFGLGQLTELNRKRYLGANWNTTDPALQIQAMRDYIKERYGTAENAVAFHKAHGWY
jgi:hypothetical protein